jgi:excisionase family DNA binding protein
VQTQEAETRDSGGLLSLSEAARYLSVSQGKLAMMLNADPPMLPSYRLGRHRRIKRSDLEALIESLPDGREPEYAIK